MGSGIDIVTVLVFSYSLSVSLPYVLVRGGLVSKATIHYNILASALLNATILK